MNMETSTQSKMSDSMMTLILSETSHLIENATGKKIVIFGAGARGALLYEALRLFGCSVSYFIDSRAKGEMYFCGLAVYEPIKIMYENTEDIFVAIAAHLPAEMINNLEGFGLESRKHFGSIFNSDLDNGTAHSPITNELDFFLGYGRSSEVPGFDILPKESSTRNLNKQTLKILTLGGSTTDPYVMDSVEWNNELLRDNCLGSWPRHLHELLNTRGIENCIYNGAIGGYSSAQELLKLLRDGLSIRPDIVIALDGINDGCSLYWYKNKYSKYHSHFEIIESVITPLLANDSNKLCFSNITYGIETGNSRWQEWYENQIIMEAICKAFGIKFISFLQPYGLHDNNYLTSCDVAFRTRWFLHNLFQSKGQAIIDQSLCGAFNFNNLLDQFVADVFSDNIDHRKHFCIRYEEIEEFYYNAIIIAKETNCIIPIIDTFYGYPDIMCDTAHCTDKGNKLLAERIFKELTKTNMISKS